MDFWCFRFRISFLEYKFLIFVGFWVRIFVEVKGVRDEET